LELIKLKYLSLAFIGFLLLISCGPRKMDMKPNTKYAQFIAKQKTLKLNNGFNMRYVDEGSPKDPVILMVHGVPTSSWLYRKMIPLLVNEGYRVIAPDLLGYGNSDKPKGYDLYRPEKMGSYLSELMSSIGIQKWTHLCHDAGGLWTWEMLKNDSSKVSSLVILNTILFKEGFKPPMQMKKNVFSKIYVKTYTSKLSRKGMMKATLSNGLHYNKFCTPEMVYGYTAPSQDHLHRALYTFFSNTCIKELPDYTSLFKSLNMKKKVIWGAKDPILNWEAQKEKAIKSLNLKNDDILILEDAKHFIQEEKASEIVNFIIK
jgi:pimeloyl-ACP methyl ester carboxylesterase